MKIVTAEAMRDIDEGTIAGGYLSSADLMERAGAAAAREIHHFLEGIHPDHALRVVVICGKGNNGGDGFVIARLLAEMKRWPVAVYCSHSIEQLNPNAEDKARTLLERDDILLERVSFLGEHLRRGDVVVDCIFGTGVNRPVRQPYLGMINDLNASGLPVVAVDIASGLNGSSGLAMGAAVVADLTIAIGLPKLGYFVGDGARHTGRLRCVDIGFPGHLMELAPSEGDALFTPDVCPLIRRRPSHWHKFDCGDVLVIGGSAQFSGAPLLAAAAALRGGAGMVTLARPTSGTVPVSNTHAALVQIPLPGDGLTLAATHLPFLGKPLARAHSVVVGPGLSGALEERGVIEAVLRSEKVVILDAGALAHIHALRALFPRSAPVCLTPHAGELKRLAQEFGIASVDPEEQATELAKLLGAVFVFKGQNSRIITPDGRRWINTSGSSALATAGAGDVLAGLIGAYAAVEPDLSAAVRIAVFIHGLAGELSPHGIRGLAADDLPELIPQALKLTSPFA